MVKTADTFYFRKHNDLIYRSVQSALGGDFTPFTKTYEEEDELQVELINTLYCLTKEGFEINYNLAASVSPISGARNKILGVRKGWPDLTCVWLNRMAFLELKAKDGRISKPQKECHEWLETCKIPILRDCRNIKTALDFLLPLGLPVKQQYKGLFDEKMQKTLD